MTVMHDVPAENAMDVSICDFAGCSMTDPDRRAKTRWSQLAFHSTTMPSSSHSGWQPCEARKGVRVPGLSI